MAQRFLSYKQTSQNVQVKDIVLFGDKEDVKLKKAKKEKPIPSQGGTICYNLRHVTHARPGIFYHSKVQLKDDKYGSPWFNLIHHEEVDGEAVGKYLCTVSGHSDFKKENVWSRYDWCHYRNWGTADKDSDEDKENEEDRDYDDDDLDNYDEEKEEEDFKERSKMYFVAVDKTGKEITEMGRITMGSECIAADWHYGLRVVDPGSKLAYAYVFGDALVNDELSWIPEVRDLPDSDFNLPLAKFLA